MTELLKALLVAVLVVGGFFVVATVALTKGSLVDAAPGAAAVAVALALLFYWRRP